MRFVFLNRYERIALRYARTLEPGEYEVWVHPGIPNLFAKAEERWITLHPNPGSDHYVRVKIRVNNDGTAHVLSGGAGLRGLKLSKLKSPKEWSTKRKKPPASTEAHAQETQATQFLREQLRQKRLEQIKLAHTLGLPGWDDGAAAALTGERAEELKKRYGDTQEGKGGAGMVAAQEARRVMGGLKRLERNLMRELVENHELRQTVLGEAAPYPEEPPSNPLGFRKNLQAEAQARGTSAEAIRERREKLFRERIEALRESDPERAERVMSARDFMQGLHRAASAIRGEEGLEHPEADLEPKRLRERAEQVRAFLKAAREAKELEDKLAALDPQRAGDPEELSRALRPDVAAMEVEVHPLEDEEFIRRLSRDVAELERSDLTQSFLERLEEAGEGSIGQARARLRGSYGFGAHTHLQSALLSAGGLGMDRLVSEVFGVEGAAQIAAAALVQTKSPEELSAIRAGLAAYQDQESVERMRRAMEVASRAEAAAAEIELPPVTDAASLAAARELNAQRKEYLEEAMHALGSALGQVEAGAALNLALRRVQPGELALDLGNSDKEQLLWGLGALGLREGEDYRLEAEAQGGLTVRLAGPALERLVTRPNASEELLRAHLDAIRKGEMDEPDWLPEGFVSYPANLHNDPAQPTPFATPPGFAEGRPAAEALGDYVASRLADGWKPSDILREVGSVDFVLRYVPPSQHDAYADALEAIFPTQDARGNLRNVDTDPELRANFQRMAEEYVRKSHPQNVPLYAQSIGDSPESRRAAYLALLQDPRTAAAFKALGDLDDADQRALRNYFYTEIAKVDPQSGKDKAAYEAALRELGPEPQKLGTDLFGGESITPEWEQWNRRRQEIVERFAGPSRWVEFVSGMRGLEHAYQAVQEHMKGVYAPRFAKFYAHLSGRPLRLGKGAIPLSDRFKAAIDPEERRRLLEQEQRQMAALRDRRAGQFAAEGEGAVKEKLNRSLEMKEKLRQAQGALFGGPGSAGYETQEGIRVRDPFAERLTLGERAEGEIAALLPYVGKNLEPTARGVAVYPGVTMGAGTKYAPQQRAIKFALAAKKTYQALGMGCVRGDTLLEDALSGSRRTFAQWLESGEQPHVWALDEKTGEFRVVQASHPFIKGSDIFYQVRTRGGHQIVVTLDHRFLTPGGWARLRELGPGARLAVCSEPRSRPAIHPKWDEIVSIEDVGEDLVYDITVPHYENYLAHGFINHNSGKTPIQIGTGTQLIASGKARKGLFLTPSIVRNQFGEEMARFTEPGRFRFHAKDAPWSERLAAYRDPQTHFVVVTHQTWRDDVIRMIAAQQNLEPSDAEGIFMAASPRERRRMLREALAHHGAEALLDYVPIDEGHNLSGREGKPDAVQQAIADATIHESNYALLASGTPVKNDWSEAYDIAYKLDPDRWEGRREEFKRNYGVDFPAAADAFMRQMGCYVYAQSVRSGVERRDVWGAQGEDGDRPIELHPEQKKALEAVHAAYERARSALREGRVDVEALRILSPRSFAEKPESEHDAIARELSRSLGTLYFSAQARAVDAAPPQHNAKIQHLLRLAEERRAQGHPGVVFARSLDAVEAIRQALEGAGHRVAVITGADSSSEKARKKALFNPERGEPQADILIMSDAGAVGLNAQRGRWLVNYDLPLTYATHAQRNARIDRVGQKNPVEVHNLVTDSAYDREAVARLSRKGAIQQVFEGNWDNLDDSGMAGYIARARASRALTPEELDEVA